MYSLKNIGYNNWLFETYDYTQSYDYIGLSKTACGAGFIISNNSCNACPLKYYSSTLNADTCIQCPYSAMTTPQAGMYSLLNSIFFKFFYNIKFVLHRFI